LTSGIVEIPHAAKGEINYTGSARRMLI